jgi:hypothetical protein
LLPTTSDEMAPSTRRLLGSITSYLADKPDKTFTRRGLRESTGLSDAQLKVHLTRLVDLEHVVCNRAGPSTTYEMASAMTDYVPDRLVQDSDRLAKDGDRLVIGRSQASFAYWAHRVSQS